MKKEVLYLEKIVTNSPYGQNLDYISFSLSEGEILGIAALSGDALGTLADVMAGKQKPSGGRILIEGKEAVIDSPAKARSAGISVISESKGLIPYMSVAENLSLHGYSSGVSFLRSPQKNNIVAHEILNRYNVCCDVETKAHRLTFLQKTQLLISRAIIMGARVIVYSGIGAGFSEKDYDELGLFLKLVCKDGISFVLLNSDIKATMMYSDRVAVMRGGMLCYQRNREEASSDDIIRHMRTLRHTLKVTKPDIRWETDEIYLVNVGFKEAIQGNLNITLKGGKLSGLYIKNMSDDENSIYKLFSRGSSVRGIVREKGKETSFSRWKRKNAGNIYCLRSRFMSDGLYENMTMAENLMLRTYSRFKRRVGLLDNNILRLALEDFCKEQGIDPEQLDKEPRHLSPELRNQIVLLSLMFAPPKILVLENPFYAADEDTKYNLLHCISNLKSSNTAIFWCGSEDTILYDFCDNVIEAL